jgi:nucleotide-binding universal stress UspA family protein
VEEEEQTVAYDKILVPVDHSHTSERAVFAARDLALLSKGEVWVLHLREREMGSKGGPAAPAETSDDARAVVDAAVKILADAGIKAHGELRNTIFGYAAKEIIADAKENDVDVIVMGSRGRGDLAGLVLGSTAHKVIHLTDRPVLVIR